MGIWSLLLQFHYEKATDLNKHWCIINPHWSEGLASEAWPSWSLNQIPSNNVTWVISRDKLQQEKDNTFLPRHPVASPMGTAAQKLASCSLFRYLALFSSWDLAVSEISWFVPLFTDSSHVGQSSEGRFASSHCNPAFLRDPSPIVNAQYIFLRQISHVSSVDCLQSLNQDHVAGQ